MAEASKHHFRVFWLRRGEGDLAGACAEWLVAAELRPVAATGAVSAPGIFGWDRLDAGSRLLAEHLDARIGGRGADFGAGWGFLGRETLARCPELRALDAARRNLTVPTGVAVAFRWHDVVFETGLGPYDWVICNPPFHDSKTGDPEIGRGFIRAAHAALVPGGRLLLVANRHLPYEAAIDAVFKGRSLVAESPAFKVIEARK